MNVLRAWAQAVIDDDMERAKKIVESSAAAKLIHRTLRAQHAIVESFLRCVDKGQVNGAQELLETITTVNDLRTHLGLRLRAVMDARQEAVADKEDSEKKESEDDAPIKTDIWQPGQELPEDSAWSAFHGFSFSQEDLLGLLFPQEQRLVSYVMSHGERTFSMEELSQHMEIGASAVRGLIMRVQAFITGARVGTFQSVGGSKYAFTPAENPGANFTVHAALQSLPAKHAQVAVHVSRHPNTILSRSEIAQETESSDMLVNDALMTLRAILAAAKTSMGVLNEDKGKHLQLTVDGPVPLGQLVALTLRECTLWQYVYTRPDQMLSLEDLHAHMQETLNDPALKTDDVIHTLNDVRKKVVAATILSSPHQSSYQYVQCVNLPADLLKKLTIEESLPLRIAAARPGVVIGFDELIVEVKEERERAGLPSYIKSILGSLNALQAKLQSLGYRRFIVNKRNDRGCISVLFLEADPPAEEEQEGEQKESKHRLRGAFPEDLQERFSALCKSHDVAPNLNDTDSGIVGALLAAGEAGLSEEDLQRSAGVTSLRRPCANLNDGFLRSVNMRITRQSDRYWLVGGASTRKRPGREG